MHVQAAAGLVHERLRHERRLHAERPCDALDEALEQHRLVRRQQRVGKVAQVHFVLADPVLRNRAADRQLLDRRRLVDAIEEYGHVVHGLERQVGGTASRRAARRGADADAAIRAAARVDQIELELAGHDRVEPGCATLRHHVGEDQARVEPQVLARGQIHHVADRLRRRRGGPRRALQESWQGPGDSVGIAVGLAHAAGVVTHAAAIGDQRTG